MIYHHMPFQSKSVHVKFLSSLRSILTYEKNMAMLAKKAYKWAAFFEHYSVYTTQVFIRALTLDLFEQLKSHMDSESFLKTQARHVKAAFQNAVNFVRETPPLDAPEVEHDMRTLVLDYVSKVGLLILNEDLQKIATIHQLKSKIGDATDQVIAAAFAKTRRSQQRTFSV